MSYTDIEVLEEVRDAAEEIMANVILLLAEDFASQEKAEIVEQFVKHDCQRVHDLADYLWD